MAKRMVRTFRWLAETSAPDTCRNSGNLSAAEVLDGKAAANPQHATRHNFTNHGDNFTSRKVDENFNATSIHVPQSVNVFMLKLVPAKHSNDTPPLEQLL
jgi:hypothetical protein